MVLPNPRSVLTGNRDEVTRAMKSTNRCGIRVKRFIETGSCYRRGFSLISSEMREEGEEVHAKSALRLRLRL